MSIEIKRSIKPVEYRKAILYLEKRLNNIVDKNANELIWILEHPSIYTAGTSYKIEEILDKSLKIEKTNRGGKITYHGPGQLICYFVIDLRKRKKLAKLGKHSFQERRKKQLEAWRKKGVWQGG